MAKTQSKPRQNLRFGKRSVSDLKDTINGCLIDLVNPTPDTIDKLKVLPVAAGVDIKIKA